MITALEVYESFYDSANAWKSLIADYGNEVEAIKAYADGAFDIALADETAKAIAKAFLSCLCGSARMKYPKNIGNS